MTICLLEVKGEETIEGKSEYHFKNYIIEFERLFTRLEPTLATSKIPGIHCAAAAAVSDRWCELRERLFWLVHVSAMDVKWKQSAALANLSMKSKWSKGSVRKAAPRLSKPSKSQEMPRSRLEWSPRWDPSPPLSSPLSLLHPHFWRPPRPPSWSWYSSSRGTEIEVTKTTQCSGQWGE